ncbi:MAG: hypothetical protein KF845_09065 [Cyclobacteriaceae bacterium]|nr:hypothetical protein [Cyclobacteriaceae bacterium]
MNLSIKVLGLLIWFCPVSVYCQNQTRPLNSSIHIQQLPPNIFKETGKLPSHINEASGLAIISPGKLWTHNDDGIPALFCLDITGKLIRSVHINSINKGWEALALDEYKNLYIGAFGNNKNDRNDLRILKINNPEATETQVIQPEVIHFKYEDQHLFPPPPGLRNFDADAMIAMDSSLYIFTKNRTIPFTGFTKIYRLPNSPGNHTAVLVDSIQLGGNTMMDYWVTGADLSPDQSMLALLGHTCIWLISDFAGNQFSTGKITKLELDHYTHKAGIAFESDSQLYIVDENEMGILGGKIYYLNLGEIYKKARKH